MTTVKIFKATFKTGWTAIVVDDCTHALRRFKQMGKGEKFKLQSVAARASVFGQDSDDNYEDGE